MATKPSRDLAHQMSRAERLLTGRVSAVLARQECTVEEWRVLNFLSDGHGHVMTEIADFAMMPVPRLTELVDRMTAEGLLYLREAGRGTCPDGDPLAYLSLQGRDRYEAAAELVWAAEAEVREAIGDQGELAGWLDRVGGTLSVPPQPGPDRSQSAPQGQNDSVSPRPNA